MPQFAPETVDTYLFLRFLTRDEAVLGTIPA